MGLRGRTKTFFAGIRRVIEWVTPRLLRNFVRKNDANTVLREQEAVAARDKRIPVLISDFAASAQEIEKVADAEVRAILKQALIAGLRAELSPPLTIEVIVPPSRPSLPAATKLISLPASPTDDASETE